MNEPLSMIFAFVAGMTLGTLFFGGLWFTVKKAVKASKPALWVLGSFFFRVGITLLGFFFVGSRDWQRLVTCMLGFIISRFLVIYLTKAIDEKRVQLRKEPAYEA